MRQVDFLFGIHDHQPVGNFGHVFKDAFERCYRPFLDVFSQYPAVKCSVHTSGPLLEWLADHEPGYLDLLRALVAAGRVEILGGGFYEPILPVLPERDAVGQIRMMSSWAEKRFGQKPTGMWLAERVWDPYLPRVLKKADIRFTVLDDTHFRAAGLRDDEMVGWFVTEREGDAVGVYPIDKNLRYKIPFAQPEEVIEYLRGISKEPSEGQPVPAVTYADDGEKFGLWPDTYKWVYEERWLARFFQALSDNKEWLHTKTLGEHHASSVPTGRLYLPTASYDEMMEWALPAAMVNEFERVLHDAGPARPFVRGGFWPNFMVKYPEANWMSKRATFASAQVAKAMGGDAAVIAAASANPPEMLKKLWRSQCNCGYWHGLFGGLYLNYIRHANYSNVIEAERMVEQKVRSREDHLEHQLVDIDRDGRDELVVTGRFLNAILKPELGASILEIDFKPKAFNVTNVLARRYEAYHDKLSRADQTGSDAGGGPRTIHDIVRVKEPGLEKKLQYDRYPRACFLDHFLGEEVDLASFAGQTYRETGWFAGARYKAGNPDFGGARDHATVSFTRTSEVEVAGGRRVPIEVEKTFTFERARPVIVVRWRLSNRGGNEATVRFGTELNLTLLAGDADDRFYEVPGGAALADKRLKSAGEIANAEKLDLVDRWSGFRMSLRFGRATLWRHPVETVSQSEGGFEATYQGSCVMPVWALELEPGAPVERELVLTFADA